MANVWPPLIELSGTADGRPHSLEGWLNLPENEEAEFVEEPAA
jgi:hypothetical protein